MDKLTWGVIIAIGVIGATSLIVFLINIGNPHEVFTSAIGGVVAFLCIVAIATIFARGKII